MRIKVLYREKFLEEVAGFYQLIVHERELCFELCFGKIPLIEVIEYTIRLKYNGRNRRFYLVGNDADKFFLLIYEIIVFYRLFVHFFVEIDGEIVYLGIGFYVLEMERQEGGKVTEYVDLIDRIKISE